MAYIHRTRHDRGKSDIDLFIEDKMKILEEFLIVNRRNYPEIESELRAAIRDNPHRDPEVVVEQIVNSMIMNSYRD